MSDGDLRSLCHGAPVYQNPEEDRAQFGKVLICAACDKPTNVATANEHGSNLHDLAIQIIEGHEKSMIAAADDPDKTIAVSNKTVERIEKLVAPQMDYARSAEVLELVAMVEQVAPKFVKVLLKLYEDRWKKFTGISLADHVKKLKQEAKQHERRGQ